MKLIVATVFILAFSGASQAASCGKWETSVSSLMGEGTELNTHACSDEKNRKADYELTCTSKTINFRFSPTEGIEGKDFENQTLTMVYKIDSKAFTVPAVYEELDGAFASNISSEGVIVKAMKSGKTLEVSAKNNKLPTYHMVLSGAGKALDKLIKRCK